jgi:hypothetical protein
LQNSEKLAIIIFMIKTNKIFALLAVFLAAIIIIEIFLYFIFVNSQKEIKIGTIKKTSINQENKKQVCFNANTNDSIMNETIIETYRRIPPTALDSLFITTTRSGTITNINTSGGFIRINKSIYPNAARDSYEWAAIIEYSNKKNKHKHKEIMPKETMGRTEIWELMENAERKPINLKDLKVGDKILVEEIENLLDKDCIAFLCTDKLSIIKK